MTVSAISGITIEGQPQELSSFLRSGVVYVVWHTAVTATLKRLSWKPHNGLDFTEITPQLGQPFRNITTLYDPVADRLVAVWDDGNGVDDSTNGVLLTAHFAPTTGELLYGPVVLFPGSNPRMSYRNAAPDQSFVLHYRTPKTGGVYGRLSTDGGTSWGSGYPLLTGKVAATKFLDTTTYDGTHVGIAQLGVETRQLREAGMFKRTRPLVSIVRHPTVADQFFIGEPSKFNNVTLTDNLRGGLVLSTDNTQLFNLDGVQQGTSDTIGAVALISVAGTVISTVASAGPSGNGDDLRSYTLTPSLGSLNVDLPGTSYAVALDVSSTHGYVAEYADNSATGGQFIVVNLTSGATGTVFSSVAGVRAVAVANFLATPLIFVGTTESGVERLRVYSQNALTPVLLKNTKLTSRANAFSVVPDPSNPSGALLYASLTDRLNIYKYVSPSAPVQLVDSITLPGGGSFYQSKIASNGNVIVATGNAGVMVLDPDGKILAQLTLSGEVISEWSRSTVYALNTLARPRDSHQFAKSRYYFRATTAGTSGAAEPSWTNLATVADNTAVWTAVGLTDGLAVGIALDETAKRIYAVGSAGGVLGTDGRVWLLTANGLL